MNARLTLVTALIPCFLFASPAAWAGGEAVFLANKCAKCHSVASEGIEGAKKPVTRDLSTVGVRRSAEWLRGWMLKEVSKENKKDPAKPKLHRTKWKGTDAELGAVVSWLSERRTAPATPALTAPAPTTPAPDEAPSP